MEGGKNKRVELRKEKIKISKTCPCQDRNSNPRLAG